LVWFKTVSAIAASRLWADAARALLNSLQMGFSHAGRFRSAPAKLDLLAAVKTEFGKFGESLLAVREDRPGIAKMEDVDVRARRLMHKEIFARDVENSRIAAAISLSDRPLE